MRRRSLLGLGLASPVWGAGLDRARSPREVPRAPTILRIALLHLAPGAGAVARNRLDLEQAVAAAAEAGADWVLTPELCVSGYTFADLTGTDWIETQPDPWVRAFRSVVADHGVTLFLGLPERDPGTQRLHNTLLVLGPEGRVLGRHRKIRTLSTGSEAWSTPGTEPTVLSVPPVGKVGLMICADAYDPAIAEGLRDRGARLLVSAANWAPGPYGPAGAWERCSADTGLPLIVCNRTGQGRRLDFTGAKSVIVAGGRRLHSLGSPEPALFLLDWNVIEGRPVGAPRRVTGFLA